jgi:hypothetical protein
VRANERERARSVQFISVYVVNAHIVLVSDFVSTVVVVVVAPVNQMEKLNNINNNNMKQKNALANIYIFA